MLRRSVIITSLCLLTACSTSVVEEADRVLPAPIPAAERNASDNILEQQDTEELQSEFSVNVSESLIAFVGAKGNITSHEGKFENFSGIWNKEENTLILTINIDSMVTDSEGLTNHLKADDYFDAAAFPEATFTSTSITIDDENATVEGDLSIKGITKNITLNGTLNNQYFTTSYNLDRTMFGVGGPAEGIKSVDANVPVEIKLVWE